jgi:capsular polysaccharide biosynthesis protein
MGEDVVRLAVLGHLARVKWRLLVALALVGALVGFGASLLFSPGYASSSKVLLQEPRDEQTVLTEAELAVSQVVLDKTAADLGSGVTGADLRDRVSATVVAGNIVQVTGLAGAPEQAQQLTQHATDEYVAFSSQVAADFSTAANEVQSQHKDEVQQRIDDANAQIAKLQASSDANAPGADGVAARAAIDQLRTTITESQQELDQIDGRISDSQADGKVARASINIIEPAVLPLGRAAPTPEEFVAGGAVLFALLGLLALLIVRRRDARLRRPDEIGAALGTSVVCTVDAPDPALVGPVEADLRGRRPRGRVDRFLREDVQRAVLGATPAGGRDPAAPYRRALGRLRGGGARPVRLLVLVPDDDPAARRATAGLVLAAAAEGIGAAVITEDEPFTQLIGRVVEAAGPGADRVTVSDAPVPPTHPDRALFRVVVVSTGRPEVPEDHLTSDVIAVCTAGTRIGWELVALSEACTDADRRLKGVVVVAPSTAGAEIRVATPPADTPRAHLNGHGLVVSS